MTDKLISDITRRNWSRLSTDATGKLMSRANKKLSERFIIPREYFVDKTNIKAVKTLRDLILFRSYSLNDAIYSLAINLLRRSGISEATHVVETLREYDYTLHDELLFCELPIGENDLLGIIYQCLLTEGAKNMSGAYYTPMSVVSYMTRQLDFSRGATFLDPCCGTGAFLLSLQVEDPTQLYGVEIDPIAALIAKVNLLLRYSDKSFVPRIKCADFVTLNDSMVYDYICTNPPWGAQYDNLTNAHEAASSDIFSLFITKSFSMLSERGVMRFLLPESVLNVRMHKDVRKFILDTRSLKEITYYEGQFSGVATRYIDVCLDKKHHSTRVLIDKQHERYEVDSSFFVLSQNYVFNPLREKEIAIIEHVESHAQYKLSDSVWALGIVTGDNRKKLHNVASEGLEPIYTGKEVMSYRLDAPRYFIKYNRDSLQQVAKEEIYRLKEKLVYRFISEKLVFAYDNSGALFLNSANILIPHIPGMNIKTVMAFLNSRLFQFLYSRMFNDVKVLKGNLLQLPFPVIDTDTDVAIVECVDSILQGDDCVTRKIDALVYKSYGLTAEQIDYIENYTS